MFIWGFHIESIPYHMLVLLSIAPLEDFITIIWLILIACISGLYFLKVNLSIIISLNSLAFLTIIIHCKLARNKEYLLDSLIIILRFYLAGFLIKKFYPLANFINLWVLLLLLIDY